MKHFPTYLTVFVLLCVLTCSTAVAMIPPDMGGGEIQLPPDMGGGGIQLPPDMGGGGIQQPPPSSDFITITGVVPYNLGDTVFSPPMLLPGEPLTALQGQLSESVPCTAKNSNDAPVDYFCPIEWDLSAAIDTATSGRITISGTLKPAQGYNLADNLSDKITCSAVVAGERPTEPEKLYAILADSDEIELLPVGQDPAATLEPVSIQCLTCIPGEYFPSSYKGHFSCSVDWDFSTVKKDVPGVYTVVGTPHLSAGFAPPEQPLIRKICVMPLDRVDLSAATYEARFGGLTCRWLFGIPHDMPHHGEYAIGQGAWQKDTEGTYFQNIFDLSAEIILQSMAIQTDYYLRISYGEGEQQRFSNVLHVRRETELAGVPSFDIGGDRDGGDQGGSNLPPLVQPAPDTSDDEDSSVSPVLETVTESSTILSGARLNQLTVEGGTMLFEKHGVAIELPSSLTNSLSLGAEQLLEVTLLRPAEDTFSLSILADGKALTVLPRTTVRLPWAAAETQKLECVNLDGTHSSEGIYEPASGTVRCTISETGAYRIRAVSSVAEPPTPVTVAEPPTPVTVAEPPTPVAVAEPPTPVTVAEPPTPVTVAEPPATATVAEPPPSSTLGNWSLPAVALLIGAGWLLYRRHPRG